MKRVIKREELINYSTEMFKEIVKPGVKIKHALKEEWLSLSGMETVDLAGGGELLKNTSGEFYIGGEREPGGIRFPDGKIIRIGSIEEIQIY